MDNDYVNTANNHELSKFIQDYHFDQSLPVSFYFDKFIRDKKEYKKKGTCCFPKCSKKSIEKSHVIQSAVIKDFISENGRVLHPSMRHRKGVPSYEMCECGVSDAGTFPGFCKEHEDYFQSFELKKTIDNEDDIMKQIQRTACFDYHWQQVRLEIWKRDLKEYQSIKAKIFMKELFQKFDLKKIIKLKNFSFNDKTTSYIEQRILKTRKNTQDINYFKRKCFSKEICAHVIIFPYLIPVITHFFMEIKQIVNNEVILYPLMFICVPEKKQTKLIFCTTENNCKQLDLVGNILGRSMFAILNFVENTIVKATEWWYIKPSVWKHIDEMRAKQILQDILYSECFIFGEYEYSIFDELRKQIINDYYSNLNDIEDKKELKELINIESEKLIKVPQSLINDTVDTLWRFHNKEFN